MTRGIRAPRKHVAAEQGRSDAAVRDDLHAARTEDPQLLTKVSKGHAGGRLTPEALELLDDGAKASEARFEEMLAWAGITGPERRG